MDSSFPVGDDLKDPVMDENIWTWKKNHWMIFYKIMMTTNLH